MLYWILRTASSCDEKLPKLKKKKKKKVVHQAWER